jgi:hypothetical protein
MLSRVKSARVWVHKLGGVEVDTSVHLFETEEEEE